MYIVLTCNTAHNFLPYLKKQLPEAHFIDIIETCADFLEAKNIKSVSVLATEGTVATKIYNNYFDKRGITIHYRDSDDEQKKVRYFIESVKQNKMTDEVKSEFSREINACADDTVILGCTELPVLWGQMKKNSVVKNVYDPLECVLYKLKEVIS